jgi:DNA-binding beta-propeller fold protein YncE
MNVFKHTYRSNTSQDPVSHSRKPGAHGVTMPAMKQGISLLVAITLGMGAIAIALHAASDQNSTYTTRTLALPDHGKGTISMDYIAYDPKTGYVWVPAINVGSVDVVDTSNGSVREISGFATNEVEFGGRKRVQGPSGVSIGDGVVYIGDRASVCAVDEKTLARKSCGHIDSTPDGVVYVASTKEVWVTAPRDNSVRILDSQTLAQKEKLTFEGRPEGYAVDAKRGRLYMNYEDKDLTTAIDLKTHKTVAKWPSSCGEDGPHGISVDQDAGLLFVACSTRAEVLDAGHNGEKLSSIDTGNGVDDLTYSPATHILYVGAARDARLTVARVDAAGKLSLIAQVPTGRGRSQWSRHQGRYGLSGALVARSTTRVDRGVARWEYRSTLTLRAIGRLARCSPPPTLS